jgi:hypothetical protein
LILKPERTKNEPSKQNSPTNYQKVMYGDKTESFSSSSVLFAGNHHASLRKRADVPELSPMKEHNFVADSKNMPVQQPSFTENGALNNCQKLFRWLKVNGYSCIKFDAKLKEETQNDRVLTNNIPSFVLPHYPNIKVSLVKENSQIQTLGSASLL